MCLFVLLNELLGVFPFMTLFSIYRYGWLAYFGIQRM